MTNHLPGLVTTISILLSILSVPASHAGPYIVLHPAQSFYDSPNDSSLSTVAKDEGRFRFSDHGGDGLTYGDIYVGGVYVDSFYEGSGFGINALVDEENGTFLSGDFGVSALDCPLLGGLEGDCSLRGNLTGGGSGGFVGAITGGTLAGAGQLFNDYSTVVITIPGFVLAGYDLTKDSYYNNWTNITITPIIPIPAAFYLFGAGLAALVTTAHRRKMAR